MLVPYVTELGLSSSIQPSILLNFFPDDKPFCFEGDSESREPPKPHLDYYSKDKAVLKNPIELLTLSEGGMSAEIKWRKQQKSPKKKLSS